MQETKPTKLYFPNLDGLRFFCFLSVFFFHSFATNFEYIKEDKVYKFIKNFLFANGNLGVNFFFVLSGFLITYLLLTEKTIYKKINVGNFYLRRILRIWPLFYFCVIFGFFIFPYLKALNGEIPNETARIGYYLTFLNNFDFIKSGLPDSSVLGVLWSVAVEEQFYLIWPLLLSLTPIKSYKWIFIIILVLSFLFRLANIGDTLILEHHTFSAISDMTVGGFSALLVFKSSFFLTWIKHRPKLFWLLIYILTIIIFLWRKQIFPEDTWLGAIDRLICSILFALIILEQCFADYALYKMGRYKLISKLGTYTYGLYCLHFIGILIAAKGLAKLGYNKNVFQVLVIEGGLSLIITIIIAYFSYQYYEKPFLKLKGKFARIVKE